MSPNHHQHAFKDDRDEEDAPFLTSHDHGAHSHSSIHQGTGTGKDSVIINGTIRSRLMVTLFTMVLAVEVGFVMAGGPMTRIYEAIACREHYAQVDPSKIGADGRGQVPEEFCKGKVVQSEIAAVNGYMEFFAGVMSSFFLIPVFPSRIDCFDLDVG